MIIITVAHQKGGVGKTTLTLNLAYCLAESLRVAIVDTDPQGSIIDLGTLLAGIRIVDLQSALERKVSDVDVMVIDTPPYLSNRLADLFAISDYVLIPTKAGILDALAMLQVTSQRGWFGIPDYTTLKRSYTVIGRGVLTFLQPDKT